jgi:hypothetical protein
MNNVYSIGVKGSKVCWIYNRDIIINPLVCKGNTGLINKVMNWSIKIMAVVLTAKYKKYFNFQIIN